MFRYISIDTWEILFRDNFTCQECGYTTSPDLYSFSIFGGLEVHHIDGNRENNTQNNKITLCRKCHLKNAHRGCYSNKPEKKYETVFLTLEQSEKAQEALDRLYQEDQVLMVRRQSGTVRAKS